MFYHKTFIVNHRVGLALYMVSVGFVILSGLVPSAQVFKWVQVKSQQTFRLVSALSALYLTGKTKMFILKCYKLLILLIFLIELPKLFNQISWITKMMHLNQALNPAFSPCSSVSGHLECVGSCTSVDCLLKDLLLFAAFWARLFLLVVQHYSVVQDC